MGHKWSYRIYIFYIIIILSYVPPPPLSFSNQANEPAYQRTSEKDHVAATANYELTMMYWHIGERINREVLDNKRADRTEAGRHLDSLRSPSVWEQTKNEL